jgi:glucose/mannose-6-phosphate isomerase
VVITSGGHLEKRALSRGVPVIKIKKESPRNRTVFPYMIVPVILLLNRAGYLEINGRDLMEAANFLKEKRVLFSVSEKTSRNIAKQTALYFYNRIPLLYTDEILYSGVILRWQYQLNENAKVLAYSAKLPEMSHNEVIGLQGSGLSSITAPLFIVSEDKKRGVCDRLAFTHSILEESGYNIKVVEVPGNDDLEKIFFGILMGDYVSFYLAIARGIDPHSVDAIDRIRLPGNLER